MKITFTTFDGTLIEVLEDGEDFSAQSVLWDHGYDFHELLPMVRDAIRRTLEAQEKANA